VVNLLLESLQRVHAHDSAVPPPQNDEEGWTWEP
jgi:hypothetical protein